MKRVPQAPSPQPMFTEAEFVFALLLAAFVTQNHPAPQPAPRAQVQPPPKPAPEPAPPEKPAKVEVHPSQEEKERAHAEELRRLLQDIEHIEYGMTHSEREYFRTAKDVHDRIRAYYSRRQAEGYSIRTIAYELRMDPSRLRRRLTKFIDYGWHPPISPKRGAFTLVDPNGKRIEAPDWNALKAAYENK